MPELLSKLEEIILETLYKRLCKTDSELGFDEVAEMINETDEEARKICKILARKKWLSVDASDVLCDKYLHKEYLRWKKDIEITNFLISEISSILINDPDRIYSLRELLIIVNGRPYQKGVTTQQLLRFMNSIPTSYVEVVSNSLGNDIAKEISYKAAHKLIRNKTICPE